MVDYHWVLNILTKAGEFMMESVKSEQIHIKGRADFVTDCDIRVQNYVERELKRKYPQIEFVAEEKENIKCTKGLQWIMDPIDGTTNFIYDYNHSAISLALKEGEDIIFGAVYNPFTRETFYAIKGEGAYLNQDKIKVNSTLSLKDSLVAFGTSPYYKELAPMIFNKTELVFREALDVRRSGSAALDLAYVACGRQDAYFEYRLKTWDVSAGVLLVTEAGGCIVGLENDSNEDKSNSINILACCTQEIQEELREILES